MGGERGAELRVTHDSRMPDPIDRLDRVAEGNRVDASPLAGREHPRVDLQMQMAVRVPGAGSVVPHRHCLDPLHRDGHLRPARPDPGRGVLAEQPMICSAALSCAIS